jgi:antitoxin component YwqK of YwqJK toxin-antitoxin module
MLIILFCGFFFMNCDKKKIIVEEYPNGSVMMECQDVGVTGKEGECIKYWLNGKVKSKTYWKEDTLNGLAKTYYENGMLKSEVPWNKGVIDGTAIAYYTSGEKYMATTFSKGVTIGKEYEYFKNGVIKRNTEWVTTSKTTFANTERKFDSLGNLIYSDHYVKLKFPSDTLMIGENYSIDITLLNPIFDNVEFLIGEFDDRYNPTGIVDTLQAELWNVKVNLRPLQPGTFYFRGIAKDQSEMKVIGKTKISEFQNFYFEKKYVVVE